MSLSHIVNSLTGRIPSAAFRSVRPAVVVPWLLAGFAVVYYSLYVNAGLNLGGEGGTAGVVALRLMSGQRPIVDTFLSYNVLWFFPVAWMFDVTGPNYLALRWYFFAFCTASGLLTWAVVHGHTRSAWYSAIPAVLVILVPGMLFRNYMPFLGILNAFLLTRAFVVERKSAARSLAWMLAAGAGLGLTYLIRIDLGVFCTVIFLGLAILYPIGDRGRFVSRGLLAAGGVVGGIAVAFLLHLPVWGDAKARGYDRAFLAQYTAWTAMIGSEFRQQVADVVENDGPAAAARPGAGTAPAPAKKTTADTWEDRGALARPPLSDIIHGRKWTNKSFSISAYFPILISVTAILAGGIMLLVALFRGDAATKERLLYPLTVLGCALALFPQFFFFRPDTPHLSEMMVPFLAALALLIWEAGHFVLSGRGGPITRTAAGIFTLFCTGTGAVYFSHAFPKESAGSIAAKKNASREFRALNGVNVKVRDREATWLPALRDAVLRHSLAGENVLCLPYSPTINFMTDRPSPLYNLYVDNSAGGREFNQGFPELMRKSSPAVVVIDERRTNRNEISRFRNWAPGPYQWLFENYVYIGRYGRNEVFARPDKAVHPVIPEAVEVEE